MYKKNLHIRKACSKTRQEAAYRPVLIIGEKPLKACIQMNIKSERLKKLETELLDLAQWLKLGLVPKKDMLKHQEEMQNLEQKILEEKERLRFLKESGESEEFALPKRPAHGRGNFQDPHSMADMDVVEEGLTVIGLDVETESFDFETSAEEADEGEEGSHATAHAEEDDEDPFSDRNRWRRGVLEDPDANDW